MPTKEWSKAKVENCNGLTYTEPPNGGQPRWERRLDLAPLIKGLQEDYRAYFGLPELGVLRQNGQKILADEWRRLNPQTPGAVDAYYQNQDAYIEDLAWFNSQPAYWYQNLPLLEVQGRVADFGAGIGSLAIALHKLGCEAGYIDLPSPQRSFAEWRFKRHELPIGAYTSLTELHALDAIVSTDTVEHLHPDILPEIARQMWDALIPGGEVRTINKFGKSDIWPMHYESETLFTKAMAQAGFFGGPVIWRKDAT